MIAREKRTAGHPVAAKERPPGLAAGENDAVVDFLNAPADRW